MSVCEGGGESRESSFAVPSCEGEERECVFRRGGGI